MVLPVEPVEPVGPVEPDGPVLPAAALQSVNVTSVASKQLFVIIRNISYACQKKSSDYRNITISMRCYRRPGQRVYFVFA